MKNSSLVVYTAPVVSIAGGSEFKPAYVTTFNDDAVEAFYTQVTKLDADPNVQVIPVLINSYGGQVYALLAMLDIMSALSKPVCTIAIGKAMSCGSVLLASGTKGYRYVGENADIMIHEVASFTFGKTTEIKSDVANTERLNTILLSKLAKFAGKEKSFFKNKIKQRTNLDWFIDATEAKKLGLVDHVGTPSFLKQP